MSVRIDYHRQFLKDLKRLAKKYKSLRNDYAHFLKELEANPTMGTDLGNGTRKVRLAIASKGKGKSGGGRIITYSIHKTEDANLRIVLLTLYDKSETANVSDAFIEHLVSTVE